MKKSKTIEALGERESSNLENKGITLIALVITIIVLLILADSHILINIPR